MSEMRQYMRRPCRLSRLPTGKTDREVGTSFGSGLHAKGPAKTCHEVMYDEQPETSTGFGRVRFVEGPREGFHNKRRYSVAIVGDGQRHLSGILGSSELD